MKLHSKLHRRVTLPGLPPTHSHVLVVATAVEATELAALSVTDSPEPALLVVHGPLTWPSAGGVALALSTLAQGGVVGIAFCRLLDAVNAKARVEILGVS